MTSVRKESRNDVMKATGDGMHDLCYPGRDVGAYYAVIKYFRIPIVQLCFTDSWG